MKTKINGLVYMRQNLSNRHLVEVVELLTVDSRLFFMRAVIDLVGQDVSFIYSTLSLTLIHLQLGSSPAYQNNLSMTDLDCHIEENNLCSRFSNF